MEFMEDQQLIIQQLKEMLRKSEKELQDKDRELEDSVAKLQKFKLQSKAKISQLTNQLKEKEKMKESSSSENISASNGATDSSEQRNRGKVIMLKKQLDDVKQMYEKMEKDLTLEKESMQNTIDQLHVQLKEKDEIILNKEKVFLGVSSELPQNEEQKDSSKVQEMYAQMVYKDSKIMELNELISEKERKIMDLQELVKEKEEVLQARNKAIHLMTEDLSRKGKSVSDQLDITRDEMRLMQEDFITKESHWNEERQQLENEMKSVRESLDSVLSNKNEEIASLQMNVQRLENIRFDLAARNAELQEKVVRLQDDFSKYRSDAENEKAKMDTLRKALVDTESQMDAKVLKARVKERSKLKALERQLEELKSGDQPQLAALQQRIAELEEEKGTLQLKLLGFEENSSSQESDDKEGSPHSFETDNNVLIEKLRNEITLLENENKDQKAKLEDSQNLLQQMQESHNQKDVECNALKRNVQDLQKMQEEICRKMDALHFMLNERDVKISEMTGALNKREEEKVSLEMKIIELEELKDMCDSKEKELLQEKKCWQDALENEKQVVMDIQKEKDEALTELEEIKISWKTMEEKNVKLEDNLSQLQNGCDQLIQKNVALQEELHLKINDNEKYNREITNLQQQLNNIQADFTREKENNKFLLEQNEDKERQLMAFFNKYSITDITDLENKWKENLDVLNDLENTLEAETISNSLQIKELEHMLEAKETSFKEEITKLEEIVKNSELEKHSLEALINEKDGLISSFQKTSNENKSYLLDTIKEKEKIIYELSAEVSKIKNLNEEITKLSDEKQIMESELLSLRKNLDEYELNIASLKEQLYQSNQNNEMIQQELVELNIQKEHHALQFETEIKQYKNTINELNKKLEVLQNQLSDVCVMVSLEGNNSLSLEEKLSSLLLDVENYKTCEKELQDKLTDIEEQKKKIEKQLFMHETENTVLQEMLKKCEKEIEAYKEQIATDENAVKKYESKVCTLDKMIEEMKEENNSLRNKLTLSECQMETNNNELQRLVNELDDLNQRYKEAIMCNEEIEREILTKVSELNSSHKITEKLKTEIKIFQNNNEETEKRLKTMDENTQILKDTIIEKEQLCNSLQEILNNKETEIVNLKSLQKQFDNLDGNLYEANEKISKLEIELKTKIEYLQDLEQKMQDNALTISSLEEISDPDTCKTEENQQQNKLNIWIQQMDLNNVDSVTFYMDLIEEGIKNFASVKRTLMNELTTANDKIVKLMSQYDSEVNHLTKILEKETERAAQLDIDLENMKQGRAEMVANFTTATQALQDKIHEFEMEKIELLKEIKTFEERNCSLLEQIEFMKSDDESYKNKILQLEKKISEYAEQMNEMTRECKNLSAELSDSKLEIENLSAELSDSNALQVKLEAMNLDVQHLKHHNEEERLKHLEENKTHEKIIEDYKITLGQMKEENKDWSEKNALLTTELDIHKMQLKQHETHLQQILLQTKEKENTILTLEEQSAELQKSLKCMQTDVERLQFFESEYHNFVNQLRHSEENLNEKDITINNLIKEIESIKLSKAELETRICELIEQLKETEENFNKQKVTLQQHIKETNNRLLDSDYKLNESKQNISILENIIQEKDSLLAEYNSEKEILLSKLEMAENLHSEMNLDIENLKSTGNTMKKENDAMKEYIKKMEEEKLKLVDHIHSLEKDNISSQTKLLELKETLMKYEDLKLELLKSKEHISLLETDSADNVQKLSTALANSNAHIHEQESKIQFLENSLENINKLLQEREDKNKSLEEEANSLKTSTTKVFEEKEKEILNLMAKVKELEVSNQMLQQEIEKLQLSESHLIEMQTLVTELETKVKDSSAQLALLSQQLQEKDDDILKYKRNIQMQCEDAKKQIERNEQLYSENVNVIGKMEILQNKIQETDELNHLLQEQVDTLHLTSKDKDERYNNTVLSYESEIESLKKSLERNGKTITELEMQCSELQSTNSSLKESMKSLHDEKDPMCERQNILHELQNSNNALEYEVQNLRSEFCKIEEERNHLISCLNEMSRKTQTFEQNHLMYIEERSCLLEQLENLKTVNENLQKDESLKIDSLQIELEKLSAENKEFKQKLNINKEQLYSDLEISEYKDKIIYLESKLKDAEMTVETLMNEHDSKKNIEDELLQFHESFRKINCEKESLQNDVIELKNLIQNKDAEYDKLSVKHRELLSTNELLSFNLQKVHSNCESLEREIKLLKDNSEKRDQKLIQKPENTKEGVENENKTSIDIIISSEPVQNFERELVQRKEATTVDITQKLLKENETMKSSLDVQKIKLEKMFAKLKAFKEKNDHLQEENKLANTKLNSIEKEKELLESEIVEKTELLRKLTNEGEKSISLYQKDISERENTITRLKEENKLLNTKYQHIEIELQECNRSRESMSLSLKKKNGELDDLLVRLQQMEKNQACLEEQLANYNRQCNQLQYEKDCIQREVEDMKGQMEMLSSDNETFQGLLENIQRSKAILETELQKQREQHVKSLKEAQNKYLQDTEELKKTLHQSELTISALQDQCKDFEEKCSRFEKHLINNDADMLNKEKENVALQEKNVCLSSELSKVLEELHSLRSFSGWESDVMVTELDKETIENKYEQPDADYDKKLMTSLKEAELKLQQRVNMLEDALEQQGKEHQLKCQEMEKNGLELHFQLNEMIAKNENLLTILTEKEKQWSEEINIWQQKETSLQLQLKNLENELQRKTSHPTLIQDDTSKLVLEGSALQNTEKNSDIGTLIESEVVDHLKQELQQMMYSLHNQSLRNENLSQEVSKLIEEKNTLQHQLSYYINMARSKEREQKQRSIDDYDDRIVKSENKPSLTQESAQMNMSTWPQIVSSNEEPKASAETRLVNVQLELEKLYQRIQESKQVNEELQKMNDNLDEALRTERARRKLIEEELAFAKEEAILNSQTPLNNEYRLLIDDDEPHMFPETNYSITRRDKTLAYRLQHWLRRKRNQCYRSFRRMPGPRLLFYFYILIIHILLLTCLF